MKLPNGIKEIKDSTFSNCPNLLLVHLPASVNTIGKNAFKDCLNLSRVFIPSSVANIGDYAFYNCVNLATVVLPGSTIIGEHTFNKSGKIVFFTDAPASRKTGQAIGIYTRPVKWDMSDIIEDEEFIYRNDSSSQIEIIGLSTLNLGEK